MSDASAADATSDTADGSDADQQPDGVVVQAAGDVVDGARKAATFVTRLGGAFSEGFSDGRSRS